MLTSFSQRQQGCGALLTKEASLLSTVSCLIDAHVCWCRWLGESRYPLAGALTLLRGRSYGARVSYQSAAPDA